MLKQENTRSKITTVCVTTITVVTWLIKIRVYLIQLPKIASYDNVNLPPKLKTQICSPNPNVAKAEGALYPRRPRVRL
jgi:hypothetical protein